MRWRSTRVACLLGALAVARSLGATPARAETPPGVWDRAKDPASGERYRLHLHAVELMNPPGTTVRPLRTLLYERARAELEQASAATSPDARLRFDLAEVYLDLDRYEEAAAVAKGAVAMAPRDSESADGWLTLAYAEARLDRTREERDAYDAFLDLSTDDHRRLNAQLNRAEAEMRLGDLDEAVSGYRDVVARADRGQVDMHDWETVVLARWGLAVALDRNGDPGGAEHEAFLASEEDPNEHVIGNTDHVFFVPAYERDWYFGLGRSEHAKQAQGPREAYHLWRMVEQTWAHYVGHAARDDRWLPLARAHLAAAERERLTWEKRLGKEKPPPAEETRERIITFPVRPHALPPRPHP